MIRPIHVGLLGIGTVGGGTFAVLRRNQEEITRRAGRAITLKVVADKDLERARTHRRRCRRSDGRRVRRGAKSRDRYRRGVDRRDQGRERPDHAGDRQRQARGHREQGVAGPARDRDFLCRPEEGRHGGLRSCGGGRCSDHQGVARGPHCQPHRMDRRHHQRHEQLHPLGDARQGLELRGSPEGGAEARLCRGRSDLRHRRHRRRPQADHHVGDRLRHPHAVQQGLYGRDLQSDPLGHPLRRGTRATGSSCSASRVARPRASNCACIRPSSPRAD